MRKVRAAHRPGPSQGLAPLCSVHGLSVASRALLTLSLVLIRRQSSMRRKQLDDLLILALATLLVLADQWTKSWVRSTLPVGVP